MLTLPLIISILVIIILLISHFIVQYLEIKRGSFFEKIRVVVHGYTFPTIIYIIIAVFGIVAGINFIFLPDWSLQFPQELQIQGSDAWMFIFGGLILCIASGYSIFSDIIHDKKSIVIGKTRIPLKLIKFYHEHALYKVKTDNLPLKVMTFKTERKSEKIYVETPNGNDFLTKNLHFNLLYIERLSASEGSVHEVL